MPKLKTSKSAAKRVRLTGSGKIKRAKANKSHILTKKSAKRKRRLAQGTTLKKTEEKVIKKILHM